MSFTGEKSRPVPEKRLDRGEGGEAIVQAFEDGSERYVYKDGTADFASTVDPRAPRIVVPSSMAIKAYGLQMPAEITPQAEAA